MEQQTKDLINNEISNNEVCLFMKGTPDAPECGFSMAISNMLKILEVNYKGINVLENSSLREGIKEFYLASCESAFKWGDQDVYQFQLTKNYTSTPTTRNYIYS